GEGLVCRDFNPNNVMVTPEGALRLIDLEHATVPGTPVRRAVTNGYAAPELLQGPSWQPPPGVSADLYSLGATGFHLVTGTDPLLVSDRPTDRDEPTDRARPAGPGARSADSRLAALLDQPGPDEPVVAGFAELVVGLTDRTPDSR